MVLVLFQTSSKKSELNRDTHVQTTTQQMLQEGKSSPFEGDHLFPLGFFPFLLAAGSSGAPSPGRLPGLVLVAGTFGITCLRKHRLDLVGMRDALGLTSVCTSTSLKLLGSRIQTPKLPSFRLLGMQIPNWKKSCLILPSNPVLSMHLTKGSCDFFQCRCTVD